MTPAEEYAEQIVHKLVKEMGVRDYVIAIGDPDANVDLIHTGGSRFWRAGIGIDMVDEVREQRRKEREQQEES